MREAGCARSLAMIRRSARKFTTSSRSATIIQRRAGCELMRETLRFSIVTPSYNQAEFLEETIRSVLDQDYPEIEYAVIDGNSTDGSVDIIRRYEDRLAFWASEPDEGQADAINKGWGRCTGDVLAFLNSDDYYLPGALQKVAEVFERHSEVGVVYGQAYWVSADGRVLSKTSVHVDSQAMLDSFQGLPQPATFVRRDVLEKVGPLDPSFHFALDGEFFIRALGNSRAVSLPDVLACMRLHGSSKSVSVGMGFAPEVLRIAEKVVTTPNRYPEYVVAPEKVIAGAHLVAGRFFYVGGAFRSAIRELWSAARLSDAYRRQILLREVPRFVLRAMVGRAIYARVSYALARQD